MQNEIEVIDSDSSHPNEASLQKVQSQVSVPANLLVTMQNFAVAHPRDFDRVIKNAIDELELVPQLAERAYYAIPYNKGKPNEKIVDGLSIKAAMCLARHWKNSWNDGRIVLEESQFVIVQGIFFDLENNLTTAVEVRVSKFAKGMLLDPTMFRNSIMAGISKARRNAILGTLPEWLKDKYFARAKELVIQPSPRSGQKVKSLQERVSEGKLAIMRDFKITESEMKYYMDNNADSISDDSSLLLNLKGLYTGLKENPEAINELFGRATKKSASMPQAKS